MSRIASFNRVVMFVMLSLVDLFNDKIQQHGQSTLPNSWTFMRKSWNFSPLFERHRNLRGFLSFSCTVNWWNIFFNVSHHTISPLPERSNVPTRFFNKSGILYSFSFKDVSSYLPPASKTTQIFPGSFMLDTTWCEVW